MVKKLDKILVTYVEKCYFTHYEPDKYSLLRYIVT